MGFICPHLRESHESRLQILQVHVRQNPDKDSEQGSSGTCNGTGAFGEACGVCGETDGGYRLFGRNDPGSPKGKCVDNLIFEVADATDLPYENHSFDVVLIANALHVMPEPEKALKEIERVLKEDGLLIAPNFVSHQSGIISCLWSGILRIAGITFEHQWSGEEYLSWLGQNGWRVQYKKSCPARITLMYVECIRE